MSEKFYRWIETFLVKEKLIEWTGDGYVLTGRLKELKEKAEKWDKAIEIGEDLEKHLTDQLRLVELERRLEAVKKIISKYECCTKPELVAQIEDFVRDLLAAVEGSQTAEKEDEELGEREVEDRVMEFEEEVRRQIEERLRSFNEDLAAIKGGVAVVNKGGIEDEC